MAVNGANLALEGDPRDKEFEARREAGIEVAPGTAVQEPVATGHKHHDKNVTFEEYIYWAKISRADERYENPNHDYTLFGKVLKKSRHPPATVQLQEANAISDIAANPEKHEKSDSDNGIPSEPAQRGLTITDEEYVNASRAVRTATWGAVFYLITTDIL
jgi:hypothetical protein